MEVVQAPSDLVWILARVRIRGKMDEPLIHKIQDQMRFFPVSEFQAI